ncbi:MAG: DUF58 domain-containing protein [Endomicrobiales bacterium]|nr:DUF58 domain-containing protein [Endomicrobiales bacterium]
MIPKEILKQIRKIEIRSGKMVNEIFAGQYSSVFKGRGMEFAEVREYIAGDDIRSIDWNVTARYGHPFVKKFTEERELTVILLVDASSSQKFGTKNKFKSELVAELSSILAFSAIKNNDRVGMVIFTDKIEKVVLPKKGRNHILRLIREILFFKPEGKGTNISQALRYLDELWRRKAVVFLLSDFIDKDFQSALRVTGRRHDLVAIKISDPREKELPKIGILELEDSESGQRICVDTSSEMFLSEYRRKRENYDNDISNILKKSKIDYIEVSTDKPYIWPLIQFFKKREKRLGI